MFHPKGDNTRSMDRPMDRSSDNRSNGYGSRFPPKPLNGARTNNFSSSSRR